MEPAPASGWLTRFVLLRGLGLVYLAAFLSLALQWEPLIGSEGLLPVDDLLLRRRGDTFVPTVFAWGVSDTLLGALAWSGVALSAGVIAGLASAPLLAALWLLHLSFVNVGQVWWGYGWELLLLEAGFLAVWLVPWVDPRPFPRLAPSPVVFWLYRWLLFRLWWGAGLIKLRGDPCWRELSCLDVHFETQPLPNPLSPWFHALPGGVHAAMVGWNHVVELILPFLCFGPRWLRPWVGIAFVSFQLTLIASGNFAYFNWLTLVLCVVLFEDEHLARVLPPLRRFVGRAGVHPPAHRVAVTGVALLVATLSVEPTLNLLSPAQAMNRSFGAWRLVNTYGAFGSVGRTRTELTIEGSEDGEEWVAYELPFKPGDPDRAPPWIAPFQPRLDWQMWFAAQQPPSQNLWLVHLVDMLLRGHPNGTALLASNPFPRPPRYVRIQRWTYRFAREDEPGWWVRTPLGPWIRPLTVDDPLLVELRDTNGW